MFRYFKNEAIEIIKTGLTIIGGLVVLKEIFHVYDIIKEKQ